MDSATIGLTRPSGHRRILGIALYAFELVAIVAAYLALAESLVLSPLVNPSATPLWPPTAIAFTLLLLRGHRIWPAILLGGGAAGVLMGRPFVAATVIGICTVLAALAGTRLVDTWASGRKTFMTPLDVMKFAVVAFVPTAMIAAVGAIAPVLLSTPQPDWAASFATWSTWWLADGAALLLIVPATVLWTTAASDMKPVETAGAFVVAAAIGFATFSPLLDGDALAIPAAMVSHRSMLGFLILGPLIWTILRGSQRGVATVAPIFFAFAAWGFSAGIEPFAKAGASGGLLLLFALAVATSAPPLIVAAAIATRRDNEQRLLATQKQLQTQIADTNQALRTAKRHFEMLIEGVADYAIFVVDTAGRVASWNGSAQRITGYTADEIVGKPFGILFRPDERRAGEPTRALELAVQQDKCEVEGWRVRKNGTPFFVTGSVSSIRDENGALIGFASVIRDATERRDAQEKLVQAREQLAMSQKMEAIGKLTGGIAHDFNNLLMIIGGNAQTFKRLLDPKLPRAIEAIQTAAKRGESLTRQLLTFSRRQQLSPTVVDLAAAVRTVRPMIESSLRGNIVYDEKIGADIWPVKVDLAELQLAIVNIAVNARDAMPNGGTFSVTVANATNAPELHRHGLDGAMAMIQFSDTGTGIPPNLIQKIFDPFFTTKEVGKGTGLGLSQVYGFAHQAGGTVTVDSKVGQGTTFIMYLPPSSEKEEAKDTRASVAQPPRPRVLVVDDSADVAEVTSSLFEHLGYEPVYRASAEAALRLLAQGSKFDLVFSDIVMPGTIDGVGLASEIRARYPKLPVILTTGYSDAAQAAPKNLRILRKPFDTDALRGFIQETVERGAFVQ